MSDHMLRYRNIQRLILKHIMAIHVMYEFYFLYERS